MIFFNNNLKLLVQVTAIWYLKWNNNWNVNCIHKPFCNYVLNYFAYPKIWSCECNTSYNLSIKQSLNQANILPKIANFLPQLSQKHTSTLFYLKNHIWLSWLLKKKLRLSISRFRVWWFKICIFKPRTFNQLWLFSESHKCPDINKTASLWLFFLKEEYWSHIFEF